MVHWLALLLKQLQKFIWHTIKIWKSWQPEYSHELLLSRHPTMIQSFHGYQQVAELSLALAFVAQVFCLLPLKHSGTQQSGFLDLIQLMLSPCLNTHRMSIIFDTQIHIPLLQRPMSFPRCFKLSFYAYMNLKTSLSCFLSSFVSQLQSTSSLTEVPISFPLLPKFPLWDSS